ncbi:Flp family type IVb pilin [Solidesulfovibrio magneticus]|uniref:Flp/Fap pilin component family protein n=1 Tax=Solidesulfovibrio magneticus (strain ATCC 700980 / DSM 13731 / RS-1) TaxID=573370 RepID=C4XMM8_SOLM1|nr:Flp family type IVb pilin [Solidesulfovibrio magneticus]BAH74819.1 Flp/Fap pilin component family protein [Solidesulfovibrio magneticus RS-1]
MPHIPFHRRHEDGATSVEYALMASLIAAVAAAAVGQFGLAVLNLFQIVAGLFS